MNKQNEAKLLVDIGTKRKMRISIENPSKTHRRMTTESQVERIMAQQWNEVYKDGNDSTRKCMKCGCCLVSCFVFIFTVTGVVFLVFASFCATSLDPHVANKEYNISLQQNGDIEPAVLLWSNLYPRGAINLFSSKSSGSWMYSNVYSSSLDEKFRDANIFVKNISVSNPKTVDFEVKGHSAVEVLSSDLACQAGTVDLILSNFESDAELPHVSLKTLKADVNVAGLLS